MSKLADTCETDEDCRKRDAAFLEKLQAITTIENAKQNDAATAVVHSVIDVYGGTLKEGHLLYADFERVGMLIFKWEEENIKFN